MQGIPKKMQGTPSSEPFCDICGSGEPAGSDDPPCAFTPVSPAQSFSAPRLAAQVTLLLSLITYRLFALSRCLQIWHQHISGLAGALSFTPQVPEQLTYTQRLSVHAGDTPCPSVPRLHFSRP